MKSHHILSLILLVALFLPSIVYAQGPDEDEPDPLADLVEQYGECGKDIFLLGTMSVVFRVLSEEIDLPDENVRLFAAWQTQAIELTVLECTGMSPEELLLRTAPPECGAMTLLAMLSPIWTDGEASPEISEETMSYARECAAWAGWDLILSEEDLEIIAPLRAH
jgi:hypothetical protein